MRLEELLPLLLGLAWLVPLGSFALVLAFGPRMGRGGRGAGYVATGAIIVSFLLSLVGLFVLNLSAVLTMTENPPQWLEKIFEFVGLGDHFGTFAKGLVSSTDIIYFVAFTAFFLWLNVLVLESKKWRG